MTKEEIEISIRKNLAEYMGTGEDAIKDESTFVGDLGADSLDMVDIALNLEKTFEIEISDAVLEKIRTVKEMIDAIQSIVTEKEQRITVSRPNQD